MINEKLWTKDFINITVVSLFIFLAFYLLLAALSLYIADKLNAGADQAGLLVTLFLISANVIRPFASKWVSIGSQEKFLFILPLLSLYATEINQVKAASTFFILCAVVMLSAVHLRADGRSVWCK